MTASPACRVRALALALCASFAGAAHAEIAFSEASTTAGISDDITPSYGIAVGDLDGDGYPDLFLNNHGERNFLYRNQAETPGVFEEVHQAVDAEGFWEGPDPAGSDTTRAFEDQHGAAWIDFDNDGDEDLLVATGDCCTPQLFVNDGGLLYNRTADFLGAVDVDDAGQMSLWYDSNGDGALELAPITVGTSRWLDPSGGSFAPDDSTGYTCSDNEHGAAVDITDDANLEILCVAIGGSFAQAWDVSARPFQDVSSLLPDVHEVADVVLGDFDGDLRTDLLLLEAALRPSSLVAFERPEEELWGIEVQHSGGERAFSFEADGTLRVRIEQLDATAPVRIGDGGVAPEDPTAFTLDSRDREARGLPDRRGADQRIDIGFNRRDEAWRFEVVHENVYITILSDEEIDDVRADDYDTDASQPREPTLLANTAEGIRDVTDAAGVDMDLACVSGTAADFDNDMDLDVYLVCRGGAENLPNLLLENDGSGVFTVVPDAGGAAGVTGPSVTDGVGDGESVVAVDYDVDGRVDLLVSNGLNLVPAPREGVPAGGPYELFHNQTATGNWIQIDLVGSASPRDAIGARVYVEAAGVRQFREQNGGFHRWSQNHKRLHFGLADNETALVTVRWQDGTEETFDDVAANDVYRITEGVGIEAMLAPEDDDDEEDEDDGLDRDSDGLTDAEEAELGTDPENPDTDGGGARDGDELAAGTDPLNADDDNTGTGGDDEDDATGDPAPAPDSDSDADDGKTGPLFGACFIATAAYGSYLQPEVMALRSFRDEWLLTNAPGRAFVRFYYRHSPPIAAYIAERDGLRTVVRAGLTPLVFAVKEPGAAGGLAIATAALLWLRRRRHRAAAA